MSQIMQLPLWVRFEPVLRFDSEGLLAMPVPYRSESFAEDFLEPAAAARACEDVRRRPVERAQREHIE